MCQRMMKEREEQIRSEYDKVLTTKLAGEFVAKVIYYEQDPLTDSAIFCGLQVMCTTKLDQLCPKPLT